MKILAVSIAVALFYVSGTNRLNRPVEWGTFVAVIICGAVIARVWNEWTQHRV